MSTTCKASISRVCTISAGLLAAALPGSRLVVVHHQITPTGLRTKLWFELDKLRFYNQRGTAEQWIKEGKERRQMDAPVLS
jgi:hypothetical protein